MDEEEEEEEGDEEETTHTTDLLAQQGSSPMRLADQAHLLVLLKDQCQQKDQSRMLAVEFPVLSEPTGDVPGSYAVRPKDMDHPSQGSEELVRASFLAASSSNTKTGGN